MNRIYRNRSKYPKYQPEEKHIYRVSAHPEAEELYYGCHRLSRIAGNVDC